MKEFSLSGELRNDFGKKAAKDLRKQNLVPCNLYGSQKDENGQIIATAFTVANDDVRKLIYTPDIHVVNLSVAGKECKAVIKELQFHPVTDQLLHIDFYHITEGQPIVMEVPIALTGLAEGVRAGGKLAASVRKLKVKAEYQAIPEKLVIDVTNLGLGKVIKVAELSFEGLELVTPKEVVVCQVKMTRGARAAQQEK